MASAGGGGHLGGGLGELGDGGGEGGNGGGVSHFATSLVWLQYVLGPMGASVKQSRRLRFSGL